MNLLVSSTNPFSFLPPPDIKFLLGEAFIELLDEYLGEGYLVFLRVDATRPLPDGKTLPEDEGIFLIFPSVTSFFTSLFLLI